MGLFTEKKRQKNAIGKSGVSEEKIRNKEKKIQFPEAKRAVRV